MERRLLRPAEAADLLGVSPESLARGRTTGLLYDQEAPPFIKLGVKTVRYRSEDIEAWADAQRTQKTNDEPPT